MATQSCQVDDDCSVHYLLDCRRFRSGVIRFKGRSQSMTIRNIQVRGLVAGVAALAVSASVMAGVRSTLRTVVVNQTTRFAEGQLAGARASSDGNQYIGCSTWAKDDLPGQDGGGSRQGICYATDARGVSGFCLTSDPALLAVIAT